MLKGSLFSTFAQLFIYFSVYTVSHANATQLSVTAINSTMAYVLVLCMRGVCSSTGVSAGTVTTVKPL